VRTERFDRFGWEDLIGVWPVLLIVGGVSLVLASARWSRTPVADLDEVKRSAWLRGDSLTSCATGFRRASLTVILGDIRLDLRRAHLDPTGAIVNVTAVFGSVDVLVRNDQHVTVVRHFVFGIHRRESPCWKRPATGPMLTIHVLGFFGDAIAKPTPQPY
jgi:hypothetical protein